MKLQHTDDKIDIMYLKSDCRIYPTLTHALSLTLVWRALGQRHTYVKNPQKV